MTQAHKPHDQVLETKPHLLIVDDEIEVAKSLQRQFRREYQVHVATNAEEAFRTIKEWPIQIVISDQRMPGLTGVEFFSRIKQSHPDTIRLLLTGYADIEAVIAAINDGSIFRYIKKPWDRVELDNVLREAYEQHFLITENKRLLNELRQSEWRYRALFENSPIAMLELDLSASRNQVTQLPIAAGETLSHYWDAFPHSMIECLNQIEILDHNQATAQILQSPNREALQGLLSGLFETDLLGFLRSLIIALNAGEQTWHEDVTLGATKNNPTYVSIYASIVPGYEQTWARSIVALIDITERKQAEEALQRTLERETELSRLRSGIISTVSHEFRTPLAIIQSSSETLTRYSEQLNSSQRDKLAKRIVSSIRRLTDLLDDVITFSRVETNAISVRRVPVDLEAVCHQLIVDMEATQLPLPQIQLTFEGDCSQASLDHDIVSKVLSHLLENAIKYSPVDGMIDLVITCDETQAAICISDQGIGIPPSEQAHIFDVFAQVSNKGTTRGIGLGLALVKRLVELHDGSISVASEESEGTKVCVTLPFTKIHP